MPKHRLAFSKADTAKFISHLDLMRTFQRSFLRADIAVKHTEGFNPHAFVSIPLPLSVGFSSACEVLECQVLNVPLEEVPARMNAALPAGITVTRCYEAVRPVKELCYVNYIVTLEYESGAPFGAERDIQALLERDSLVMTKRSKKAKSGFTEVDLIPLIARASVEERRDTIALDLVLKAQNPGLNPELVVAAVREHCPDASPDFVSIHRRAVLDGNFQPWE
ncbi:TIGR03936 family radical SAM-associated protein [Flavonifractor sp.]|uniref:TIGR03936 family radical SAM-associated protein n=1 Tax=Flavonifractor sp. TaxID=2049025 RepID=UPI0025BCCCEF|nr:TIGR03936 family radical SAM-associated protein [Flavonifractor sp.]